MSNESDYPAKYALEDGSGFYLLETGTDYYIKELQNYPELIVSDGALSYWRLGESVGPTAADALGGNDGTYVGSPTLGVVGPLVGEAATAASFVRASSQWVTTTNTTAKHYDLLGTGSMTAEFWGYVPSSAKGLNLNLIPFDNTTTVAEWDLKVSSQTNAICDATLYDNATGVLANPTNSTIFKYDIWNHVVLTANNSTTTAILYINGVAANTVSSWSGTGTSQATSTSAPTIAADGSLTVRWEGRVAEVAFYPTALTADQVARHYRCGLQYFASGIGMAEPSQYPQLLVQ